MVSSNNNDNFEKYLKHVNNFAKELLLSAYQYKEVTKKNIVAYVEQSEQLYVQDIPHPVSDVK